VIWEQLQLRQPWLSRSPFKSVVYAILVM